MQPSYAVRTLVLVGKTGNGKSATGNSILWREAFNSKFSSKGVTQTSQLATAVVEDGMTLNVIDTPGLFDPSAKSGFVSKEIVKCIRMAEDGIHAFLIVLSVRNRFSVEEEKAFRSLRELFGDRVVDYCIIVFTNGDELEASNQTLQDYLDDNDNATGPLKEVLQICGKRCVLFNNKPRRRENSVKTNQLKNLLVLVNKVVDQNDGQPYTNELFVQFQLESKLKKTTGRMDQQLLDARRETENKIQALNKKTTGRMNQQMLDARRETENKIQALNEKTTRRMNQQVLVARRETENKIRELNAKIEYMKRNNSRCFICSVM